MELFIAIAVPSVAVALFVIFGISDMFRERREDREAITRSLTAQLNSEAKQTFNYKASADFYRKLADQWSDSCSKWREMYYNNQRELEEGRAEAQNQQRMVDLQEDRIRIARETIQTQDDRIESFKKELEIKSDEIAVLGIEIAEEKKRVEEQGQQIEKMKQTVENWRQAVEDGEEWKNDRKKSGHPEDDPDFRV